MYLELGERVLTVEQNKRFVSISFGDLMYLELIYPPSLKPSDLFQSPLEI